MPKRKLSEIFLQKLKPQAKPFLVWDDYQKGLAVRVQPTGHMSWKCIYPFHGRPRWYHIGDVAAIGLADARKLAARVMFQVAEGKDPAAEKRAERSKGTFEELAANYLEYAKKKNRSWQQADNLIRRYAHPCLGKLLVADISRSDIKAMMTRIKAPSVANQTLAAVSAIFSWAIREDMLKVNPCTMVERNPENERERVLSDSEIPKFWAAFDDAGRIKSTALKMILLTGQRPGEVVHMRREHIVDGWWQMPGQPVPELKWPGTKNGQSHRVWLPKPALALLEQLDGEGFVFAVGRGKSVGRISDVMGDICEKLDVERATPHDLRRTHGSTITGLGFGSDAMNRIQNHREGGIASVYDRHGYAEENKKVMDTVAAKIMSLVEGEPAGNVVKFGR